MANTMIARRRQPLRSLFDDLFQDLYGAPTQSAERNSAVPMDIAETADFYRLAFELPGIAEDEIQLQVEDNQLVVSAERKFEKEEGVDYHRVEQRYGSFARSIRLPREVQMDEVKATYKHGVLTVTVPKAEPSTAKKVEISCE